MATRFNSQFARLLIAACAISALVACSSGVKLNEVPVEDKTGQTLPALAPPTVMPGSGAGGAAAGERAVAGVQISPNVNNATGASAAKVVYFDYDSFVIRPEFQGAIDAHAKYLNVNKTRKLAVEGHTDERGGREYNLALGQKRSEAVRQALGLLGVADAQVEAVSFGKEKPAATGADEASFAKNRRAEINYK